jgi:hypothetical protein
MFNFRIIKTLPFFVLFLLALWAGVGAGDSAASLQPTPTITPFPREPDISVRDISFKEMELEEHTLRGPYDQLSHEFVLPDGWQIQANSYVEGRIAG